MAAVDDPEWIPLSENERKHLRMSEAVGDPALYGYHLLTRGDRPRLVKMAIRRVGIPVVLPMLRSAEEAEVQWALLAPILEEPLAADRAESLRLVITDNGGHTFLCPHCLETVRVDADMVNCTIFRHAVFRDSGTFVDPHAPKATCDGWIRDGKVHGCGKPFKFDGKNPAEPCDYV
jgi:hypothetical protein